MISGGVVLCGGHSRRMGQSKAMLPFGPERMLQRVVRLVSEAVEPVVVVAAVGQELPPLPADVRIVHDRRPDQGPLEGLAVGLRALAGSAEAAFVTACDVPLLAPQYVRRLVDLAAEHDVAVPHVSGYDEPLSAVYRIALTRPIEALLAAGRLRPVFLFDQVRTRRVSREDLADVDPTLASLTNLNTPADYQAALARAGFST